MDVLKVNNKKRRAQMDLFSCQEEASLPLGNNLPAHPGPCVWTWVGFHLDLIGRSRSDSSF